MSRWVPRDALRSRVVRALREAPVVALLGPRQCGKSTLANQIVSGRGGEVIDLENPADARRLAEPMSALEPLRGLVVIDEVQRAPDVLPVLRVLSDRRPVRTRFLLLGSAAPNLHKGSSERFAGRVPFICRW